MDVWALDGSVVRRKDEEVEVNGWTDRCGQVQGQVDGQRVGEGTQDGIRHVKINRWRFRARWTEG